MEIGDWAKLRAGDRKKLAATLAKQCELDVVRIDDVAVFVHRPSQLFMHLVPGGEVRMGLSDEDLTALREQYQFRDDCDEVELAIERATYRHCVSVRIKPFLLSARPLSGDQLDHLVHGEAPKKSKGRALLDLEKMAKLPAAKYIAHLEKMSAGTFGSEAVSEIESTLGKIGLRLPSESQWEHAARGGTKRLFAHGDTIPKSPNVGVNPCGFVDMGADGEVCADGWVPTLEGIPTDGSPRPPAGERAARGGAAACYPWQDCAEWTLLLCASRGSSQSHEGFLTARAALELP